MRMEEDLKLKNYAKATHRVRKVRTTLRRIPQALTSPAGRA
jgi:hypothetical protein